MGLIDKFKNLFTEEVEEEEPIKKEVIQVEIPSPSPKKKAQKEESKPVEKKEENEPKKEEYQFPFFDDEDFHTIEEKEEKPKKEKKRAYQNSSSHNETRYKPVKEEKRVFKPTPIISPVYGILDKNYQKDDIKSKNTKLRSYYNPKEATVDEIRNKAYGTLEDDIETTLFGKDETDYKPQVEEKLEEVGKSKHSSDDLTDLLEAELSKDEIKEEKKEENPRKISDSELFSMIDSMYQKGDKND